MLQITIPTPCHEDWNNMIPNEQGRHCNSCVKTVVDFTQMNDDEVKHFLLNRNAEHLCGRFKNEQLHRISIALPQNIFQLDMPWWKRFLVASLLAFSTMLFSCDANVSATPLMELISPVATPKIPQQPILMGITVAPIKDTIPENACNIVKGEVAMQPRDTMPEILGKIAYVPKDPPPMMGAVAYQRVDTAKKPQNTKVGMLTVKPQKNKKQ